jgi:hypothetical protein
MRFDRAVVAQWNKTVNDLLAGSEDDQRWDMETKKLNQRIAALELFDLQTARRHETMKNIEHKSDRLQTALAQWQENKRLILEQRMAEFQEN